MKKLLFPAVCILILIPTVLAFQYRKEARSLAEQVQILTDDVNNRNSLDTTPEPGGTAIQETQPPTETEQPAEAEQPAPEEVDSASEPLTADPPSYQSLYEDFYAPEPYHATTRREKVVYLTFDDGPSERTDEILRVLDEKEAKATFFVIGQSEEENLDRMRRIVAAGHTIGMHSYTHNYSAVYSSVEGFLEDFYRIFCQIREATGVTPTVFRCPGGSINGYDGGFYQEILSEMIRRGFVPYDWNVSSEDAVTKRAPSVDTLVNNVVRNSNGKVRSFVLFHDSAPKATSARAIGPVIDQLRAAGYTFEAITPDTMPVLYSYP